MKRALESWLPTIVLALTFIVYDRFFRERPEAAPAVVSDPAVVKLGTTYAKALVDSAAATLEGTAGGSWTTTAQMVDATRTQFEQTLADAWKPVSSELQTRFGATSDQAPPPATATAIRQFFRDLATGARKNSPK